MDFPKTMLSAETAVFLATPIQDYSEVYIKQGEFGASEYQNEKGNGMVDLEIKEEPINPFVEHE